MHVQNTTSQPEATHDRLWSTWRSASCAVLRCSAAKVASLRSPGRPATGASPAPPGSASAADAPLHGRRHKRVSQPTHRPAPASRAEQVPLRGCAGTALSRCIPGLSKPSAWLCRQRKFLCAVRYHACGPRSRNGRAAPGAPSRQTRCMAAQAQYLLCAVKYHASGPTPEPTPKTKPDH